MGLTSGSSFPGQSRTRRRQFYLMSTDLLRKPSPHRLRVEDSALTIRMTASSQTSPFSPPPPQRCTTHNGQLSPILGCRSRLSNIRGDLALAETNLRSSDFNLTVLICSLWAVPSRPGKSLVWLTSLGPASASKLELAIRQKLIAVERSRGAANEKWSFPQ